MAAVSNWNVANAMTGARVRHSSIFRRTPGRAASRHAPNAASTTAASVYSPYVATSVLAPKTNLLTRGRSGIVSNIGLNLGTKTPNTTQSTSRCSGS